MRCELGGDDGLMRLMRWWCGAPSRLRRIAGAGVCRSPSRLLSCYRVAPTSSRLRASPSILLTPGFDRLKPMAMAPDAAQAALLRRGFVLEYVTLSWNVAGIVILAIAAISARSVALAGFGLDSLIEIGASTVVIWELSGT